MANKTQQPEKNKVMNIKHTVIGAIIAVTQSQSVRPALMTLALVVAVLGSTGCQPHH